MNVPHATSKPTMYAGVRYRSRLEARWAKFFDKIGLRHEYEPVSVRIGGHRGRYCSDPNCAECSAVPPHNYIPDFKLTIEHEPFDEDGYPFEMYVEVKSDDQYLDRPRMVAASEVLNRLIILGPEIRSGSHTMLCRTVDDGLHEHHLGSHRWLEFVHGSWIDRGRLCSDDCGMDTKMGWNPCTYKWTAINGVSVEERNRAVADEIKRGMGLA